jgi:hypothetical protein
MTPVFQTRFGTDGNCWAACLATVFDVPLSEVDHCACNHADWFEQTRKWLAGRGLFDLQVQFYDLNGVKQFPFVAPPDGTLCVLSGKTTRGLFHVVVARISIIPIEGDADLGRVEFNIVHDPYPSGSTLTTIEDAIFFAKIM